MSNLVHSHKNSQFSGIIALDENTGKKKVKINSPAFYQTFLNLHCAIGSPITLTVTSKKPKRTIVQNSYLWAYYTHISDNTGHTPEEVHEWSKAKCLPSRIANVFGDKVRMKTSTTDLSVSEFVEYVMKIQEETGITMPPLENFDLTLKNVE